jgi:hypothetical protein
VTPATPGTVLQSFSINVGNDEPARDPTAYVIWGTNSFINSPDNSAGDQEFWTRIALGTFLATDPGRFGESEIVTIDNSTPYDSYRITFPRLRGAGGLMQLSELNFFETPDGSGPDFLQAAGGPSLAHAIDIPLLPSLSRTFVASESVVQAIDGNVQTKYYNDATVSNGDWTGLIVTPNSGPSVLEGLRITTANDSPGRDPVEYRLYGTNDPVVSANHSSGNIEEWTEIGSGLLDTPLARFAPTEIVSVNPSQLEFTSYRLVFPNLRSQTNSPMQIAEVELIEDDPVTLVVDRTTGDVFIRAEQDVTIGSYAISSSSFGSLVAGNWLSVADNADQDSGTLDPNDVWQVDGTPTNALLAESDAPGGADDGFTLLASDNPYYLGNIFLRTPYNDLRLNMFDPAGELISQSIEFIGNPIELGDLNYDGIIGFDDYQLFVQGFAGEHTGLSLAESYLLGDFDGDLDTDIDDFQILLREAGGLAALLGTNSVPEPAAATLVIAALACCAVRRRRRVGLTLVAVVCSVGLASTGVAQTYTNLGPATVTTTTGGVPQNLFDDTFLDDPFFVDFTAELFNLNYNNPNPDVQLGNGYAGTGAGPMSLFFDMGSLVTTNSFAFSQRAGDLPRADRVGTFEFWFDTQSFNSTLPARPADAVVRLDGDDPRLLDSIFRPYPLAGDTNDEFTFQFAALRLTISEVSASQPINNIGGSEFRFTYGPSPVILEVDRGTGAMTLINNGPAAQSLEIRGIEIESPSGSLMAENYTGTGFANWLVGASGNDNRLAEANFAGTTTLAAGASLSLGTAYDVLQGAEDLLFRFAGASLGDPLAPGAYAPFGQPHVFDGVVRYVGAGPAALPGDFNGDNIVDAADYTVWRDNLGAANEAAFASGTGSGGGIDATDYALWRTHFGQSLASALETSPTAVPEPKTLCMALLLASGLVLAGKRATR